MRSTDTFSDLLRAEFGDSYENIVDELMRHPTLTYDERALTGITMIVLHHTDTSRAVTPETVARYHVQSNDWPGIGYHIYVRDYNGRCTVSLVNYPETRSYHAHTVGNEHGLAVCVAGKFDTYKASPAEKDAIERITGVVRRWATWNETMPVVGHGSVPGNDTACPGNLNALITALNSETSIDAVIWKAAKGGQTISPNPDSALEKEMRRIGYAPIGNEMNVWIDGEWQGVTQLGYQAELGDELAFFATNKTPTNQWVVRTVGP